MDELMIHNNVAYGRKGQVAFLMQSAPGTRPAENPTTGILKAGGTASDTVKPANWGDDNDFPRMIKKLLDGDAEMKELINFCVRAAYSKGLVCLQRQGFDENNNPKYVAIEDQDLIDWFESPQVRRYCIEAFQDLFTYFNVFPELITSRDRKTIAYIGLNEAIDCRWAVMGDDGKLSTVIHSKNWPGAKLDDSKDTTIIPALDPYDFDMVENLRANRTIKKFIYPISYPTIGNTYYQVAHWDGLRVSGWLLIAAQIPAFKQALLKNQMTIKYLIRIPNNYWASVYKDWDKWDDKVKKEKKKEKLKEINDSLSDVENTGKSILNEVGIDPVTKEKIPGWEIEVIDDKTKAGAFLEDSQEASAHKMRSLGLDPTLVGTLITGKGMGAGSGSDKQLAWNIYLALIDPYREIILEPLHFIAKFNGITQKYPGFRLKFRDSIMETVNGHNQNVKEALT